MTGFVVRRIVQGVITLLFVTFITFFLINAAPGGPASMMQLSVTASTRHALAIQLGLNQPIYVRYLDWLGSAAMGNLGQSLASSLPVSEVVGQRFLNTLQLAVLALLISLILGITLGVASARRRGKVFDLLVGAFGMLSFSIPAFWLAILLILLFSVDLHWLPASGVASNPTGFDLADRVRHLAMPVIVLALFTFPNVLRFTRAAMIDALSQDYVRTARAKGVARFKVIYRHALRNALIPVISVVGVLIPRLLGGAIITETIFGWPGMGQEMVLAATGRDYPMVMGLTVVVAVAVIATNLLADILYSVVDPRIVRA